MPQFGPFTQQPFTQTQSNPLDLEQISRWIGQESGGFSQIAGPYSQGRIEQTRQGLQPLFGMQQRDMVSEFTRLINAQTARAGRERAEYASFKGTDPGKASARAQRKQSSTMTPAFFEQLQRLLTAQTGQTMGASAQGAQFDMQKLIQRMSALGMMGQLGAQNEQMKGSGMGIGDWVGLGLAGAGTAIGGPLLGGVGYGIGKSIGGG